MKKLKESCGFLLGIAATLTVSLLTGSVFAAPSGQVAFNQAGIRLFGEPVTAAGESFRAPNGQEVPSVITYTDGDGGKTNYLSVRQLSELLDMELSWNAETNSVDIATWNGTPGATVHVSGNADGTLEVTPAEGVEVEVVEGMPEYPDKPEYGVVHGAYQEIDPATVDTSGKPTRINLQNTRVKADDIGFPTSVYNFHPLSGKHVVFEVKNNGASEQVVKIARQTTIAASPREAFTDVSVAPGETLRRAFSISEDSSRLERNLLFEIDPAVMGTGTDVTVSLTQYK